MVNPKHLAEFRNLKSKSSLGVAREMELNAFRQQPFPPALTPACERGATALRLHARAKTVLLFSGAFGWLVSTFHKSCA
jgi:hypothetical protein